jgi:hypothetical protein
MFPLRAHPQDTVVPARNAMRLTAFSTPQSHRTHAFNGEMSGSITTNRPCRSPGCMFVCIRIEVSF